MGRLCGQGIKNLGVSASIKRIALCKQSPALSETFFQGEALGASAVEKCSRCKVTIKDCRICSSEKALLSASELEEYSVLKDHTVYDPVAGKLTAKYPFSQDPSSLLDNSSQALGAQKSQEKR